MDAVVKSLVLNLLNSVVVFPEESAAVPVPGVALSAVEVFGAVVAVASPSITGAIGAVGLTAMDVVVTGLVTVGLLGALGVAVAKVHASMLVFASVFESTFAAVSASCAVATFSVEDVVLPAQFTGTGLALAWVAAGEVFIPTSVVYSSEFVLLAVLGSVEVFVVLVVVLVVSEIIDGCVVVVLLTRIDPDSHVVSLL